MCIFMYVIYLDHIHTTWTDFDMLLHNDIVFIRNAIKNCDFVHTSGNFRLSARHDDKIKYLRNSSLLSQLAPENIYIQKLYPIHVSL